jgi:hypothetical protein
MRDRTTEWADWLSIRAVRGMALGLLVFTLTEGAANRMTGVATRPALDAGVCVASAGVTALALVNASSAAVVGGVAAWCQCAPLVIDALAGMTCP